MTKLKISYLGHSMRRQDSLEVIMMAGKVEGSRKRRKVNMGWVDLIKPLFATDRLFWRSLSYKVATNHKHLTTQINNLKIKRYGSDLCGHHGAHAQ